VIAVACRLPGRWGRRHRARCLRCQAAEARARSTARLLRSLADEVVPAPPELAPAVLRRIGRQDARAPRRELVRQMIGRYAAAGGVTVATAAAVATGVIRRRSRMPA